MSRGGRGGGWGGGAGGPNAAGKMGGQALPWDWDPELEGKLSSKPSERFPPIQPPIAEPPTYDEKRIVAHYRTLRARIHDGPFYTILDSSARISKTGHRTPATAHFDPFENAQTYSQRFVRKRNTLPRLSTRPFVKEFFPRELWSTIDPGEAQGKTNGSNGVKKSLQLHTRTKADKWAALANAGEDDDDLAGPDDEAGDDNDNDDAGKADDEDKDEEDPDQFDEDDEDMDDDYNAENYFDGGDDDDFGADDGGGDGDDY